MPKSIVKAPKRMARNDFVKGLVRGEMERFHKSTKEMSLKADCCEKTLARKIENPEEFTLKELYAVMDALNVKIVFIREQQPI